MLHVLTWVWGEKYGPAYVQRLESAVSRHLKQPHVFHVCIPGPEDDHLTSIPGCFARLRAFDPDWQSAHGINPGDRILNLDLDLVITGELDDLVDRDEPFVILQDVNAVNPCDYNGSVWMLAAGYRPDVWSDFSLKAAAAVPYWAFPDDQAWFFDRMPDAGAWRPADGVYGFQKRGWPGGESLPLSAKIVAFFGKRDPSQYLHIPWVREHWA